MYWVTIILYLFNSILVSSRFVFFIEPLVDVYVVITFDDSPLNNPVIKG